MPTAAQNQKDADRAKRWVTMASVATAVVLLSIKLGVWLQSGSVALLASAAEFRARPAAALATFVAVRYAASPADQEHRYGHGKAEAFASLLQAGLVFASAALIGEQAIEHILHPRPVRQESWALGVMAVSIVMTVGLIAAQSAMLRRGRSVAVSADRMHYITDFGSNIIALAAIGVTALTGLTAIDAVGGLAVAVLLLWGAVVVFREASRELMDRELPDDARKRIGDLCQGRSSGAGRAPASHPRGRPQRPYPDARRSLAGAFARRGPQDRGRRREADPGGVSRPPTS